MTEPTDRAGPSATDYDPIASDRLAAPGWRPDREAIAKAIRETVIARHEVDSVGRTYTFTCNIEAAADAILALKPPPPTEEMR